MQSPHPPFRSGGRQLGRHWGLVGNHLVNSQNGFASRSKRYFP